MKKASAMIFYLLIISINATGIKPFSKPVIHDVNSGGCGLFAYYLSGKLHGCEIFVLSKKDLIKEVSLYKPMKKRLSWRHVVVSWNGKLIDYDGSFDYSQMYERTGCSHYLRISRKALEYFALNPQLWNREFNRGQIMDLYNYPLPVNYFIIPDIGEIITKRESMPVVLNDDLPRYYTSYITLKTN